MALQPGTRLGPYEVVSALGSGGMGEVYRATDTTLNRQVALKVLPEAVAADVERVARFKREAQVLASLNHPHIAQVYGFETSGPVSALAMELVEGPTLADRIDKGAVPLDEALAIARQIADALEAAHEQGIIHRDLKPANIKVRDDGTVKVLDFGLAKALEPSSGSALDVTVSPTITSPAMTRMGVILGTAAYMSSEQAAGRPVDKRADIWSFGVVLWETLAGRRLFEGESLSHTLADVLRAPIAFETLPANTPPAIQRLLRRCLERDPKRRLRDIGEARVEIDEAIVAPRASGPPSGAEVRAGAGWARTVPWMVAAVMALVSLVVLTGLRRHDVPISPVIRFELAAPPGVELYGLDGEAIAVSPDGMHIAFVGVLGGTRQVYVRALDQFEAVPIQGTDNASQCFFSADSRAIGFIDAGTLLKKVTLADGLVTAVFPVSGFDGARWGADERIVVARAGTLWRVPAAGGPPTRLTTLDTGRHETLHTWPTILPGAKAVLFASVGGTPAETRIESIVVATGERRVLVEGGTFPLYVPDGHLIFYRDGALLAAPFDATRLEVTGAPSRIPEAVPQAANGTPLADVSATGTLVYAPTTATATLVWVSRQGDEQPLAVTPRVYTNPRMAPDGNRVLVQAGSGLWIQDVKRATFTRLTPDDAHAGGAFPVWTPDGSRVIYRTATGLRGMATDGSGREEAMPGTTSSDYPGSVSPDGTQLIFVRLSPESSGDVYVASLRGEAQIKPILKTPAYEGAARFSPDGHWIAYASNESGRMEVYLRPYPALDRKSQISTQGGTQPVWNPNGTEIFYRNGNKMMAVTVSAYPGLALSEPRVLFEHRYSFGAGITLPNYDVSADGQHFAMIKDELSSTRLNVVLNWANELNRRVALK
jgi:hypothetical protein